MKIFDIEKKSNVLIIGSGNTVKVYKDKILAFIKRTNCKTIGINYMTNICIPDYHLWTNKQRYSDLGQCISPKSQMLFGCGLSKRLIRKHHDGDYLTIDYIDRDGVSIAYNAGTICGRFRTAGVLAVMVAHVMGAQKPIFIVGMDGFTLHTEKDLKKEKQSHHCYGNGYTDDATWEQCVEKDRLVDEALHNLRDYGIRLNILTPTKFVDFYNEKVLN